MRISTAGLHQQGIANILRQQSELARVQNQISSNSRLLTAADDPAAAARALELDHQIGSIGQWQANIGTARDRLSLEESALAGVNDSFDRIRELVLQANNATQSAQSRETIAAELDQLYQQLLDHANADDGNGRYLFAGSTDAQPPFVQDATGVSYQGDQTGALLPIGAQRRIADGDDGVSVFLRPQDAFFSVRDLIAAVRAPVSTAAERTQAQSLATQGLTRLQAAQDQVAGVRASVGHRLAVLDSTAAGLDQQQLIAQSTLSEVRDIDLVEASGRLSLAQTILQAAQQTYIKVQGLSLFDFLR